MKPPLALPVQTVLSGKRVDDVMLNAVVNAGLLTLGSRYPDGHSYSRLGATTSRLIHKMTCPTLVVGRIRKATIRQHAPAGSQAPGQ